MIVITNLCGEGRDEEEDTVPMVAYWDMIDTDDTEETETKTLADLFARRA